jgi:hypothetical protein
MAPWMVPVEKVSPAKTATNATMRKGLFMSKTLMPYTAGDQAKDFQLALYWPVAGPSVR